MYPGTPFFFAQARAQVPKLESLGVILALAALAATADFSSRLLVINLVDFQHPSNSNVSVNNPVYFFSYSLPKPANTRFHATPIAQITNFQLFYLQFISPPTFVRVAQYDHRSKFSLILILLSFPPPSPVTLFYTVDFSRSALSRPCCLFPSTRAHAYAPLHNLRSSILCTELR